jgi:hypothetical protein
MIYKDICCRKAYTKDGIEKVTWLKCGTLRVTDAGKEFIEINMFPNTSFFVFPNKDKAEQPAQPEQSSGDAWLNEEQQ